MNTDAESASPTLCRLQLASELRQLQLGAGLKGSEVVARMLWSASKITRLETTENAVVEPSDVIALCEMYGADSETRSQLETYAAVTKTKRDWWQSKEYRQAIKPSFPAYLRLEAAASVMQNYETSSCQGCSRPRRTSRSSTGGHVRS
ncbi:helix-turn-helix transcriptional regulator [Streptomyces sp. NPDC047097]|uniref:helix-turn-helix domain-containing protein n=1 Tax=Streptomyces sp. NPDC047097 TaxID=3155260 RepID=UPI0033F8BBA5